MKKAIHSKVIDIASSRFLTKLDTNKYTHGLTYIYTVYQNRHEIDLRSVSLIKFLDDLCSSARVILLRESGIIGIT